jgi:hypothetical protein
VIRNLRQGVLGEEKRMHGQVHSARLLEMASPMFIIEASHGQDSEAIGR